MMNSPTTSALGPLVAVYGLVGHDERILILRDRHAPAYRLPGGLVRPGESVEDGLRRVLREQVDADIAHLDFCATVELHGHTDPNGPPVYELALLFDVTITDPEAVQWNEGEVRWVADTDLHQIDVRPAVIAERLRSGTLTAETPWWPSRS
ncbi:NUDIX domain-containing protein [Saccharothrix deserti]|uniref:NUDIX domain-containing protein n=1 Tax=Saccharothrix deserti TaxID=2593674 RepID=UPI00131C601D|nr:NUDIX domain-containing protein [Saccharothrix deserti]